MRFDKPFLGFNADIGYLNPEKSSQNPDDSFSNPLDISSKTTGFSKEEQRESIRLK
jgi:hypothetical protein